VFERTHPKLSAGAQMLVILAWRVLYIMDWASDLVAARDVNRFNSHYGGSLGFLLFVPYAVCAVGMYFPAMKELPIIALKRGLHLQGREGIKFMFVCTALPLAFVADAWLTFRFLLWPTRGYYERAFATMRRIVMMVIDCGLATILQLQILSSSIPGVLSQLLVQAIVISMLNFCINGIWLRNEIAGQHKPWFRFIIDAFRVGMSAIPGLDTIRDGSTEVEILSGIEHQSQLAAIGQAMIDAGPYCKVQQLTVKRCKVTDAGVHALLSCLDGQGSITIQRLNLEHNEVLSAKALSAGNACHADVSLILQTCAPRSWTAACATWQAQA
jgi:hypothetical protein